MAREIVRKQEGNVWRTEVGESGAAGSVTAADIDSQATPNGEVLTADGAGGADWQPNGGSQPGAAVWKGPYPLYGAWWQGTDMTGDPPDAGTFTLTWDGMDSDPINWDDDAAAVQAALEAIPALNGKVTCSGGPFPGVQVYVAIDQTVIPFELVVSNNLLTASAAPVADPLVSLAKDPAVPYIGIAGPTLAADDMLEDIFVRRRVIFPNGSKIEIRLDLTGGATWDIPNAGVWKLDDAADNWPAPVSGWDGSDPGYANLGSESELEIWFADGFYRELPVIADEELTFYATLQSFGIGNTAQGFAEFYFKVSTPAAP